MFLSVQSFCQSLGDTLAIKKVEIVASKKNEIEIFSKHIDSLTLSQFKTCRLSDLLNEYGIFIKSFGTGSVATVSAQGTSAYHTQVYWNGIPINNAMLGLSDFAMMPVSFADEIFISNSTNEKGNCEIGAAVHMNAVPKFNNKITASVLAGAASFDNYKTHTVGGFSSGNHDFSVKYFHEQGKNNFPFINIALYGKPEAKQTNNKVMQDGLAADYFFKVKQNHLLSVHAWVQHTYRENPPTMTTEKSVAFQNDNVNRFLIDYSIQKKVTDYKLQLAWLNESINYADSLINLESFGRVKTLVSDLTTVTTLSSTFSIDAGITNSHYYAFADEYKINREQNRASVFATLNYKSKKQTAFAGINARQEFLNEKTNPLIFSLDSKIKIFSNLFFTANIAFTHRQPTLNDLYWVPGGNQNLKPEKSLCQNAELNYSYSKNIISVSVSAVAFNKYITNWIQWLPGSNGYWEPQNVYKIWARGTEEHVKFEVSGLNTHYFIGGNFSYTRSTRNENDNSELNNRQLIYVPEITTNAYSGFFYRGSGIFYSINFKGICYTSSDNKEFLKDYSLQKISVQQKIVVSKKLDGTIKFSANNLFDVTYQTIPYRPMPGINYEVTIQLSFKQNINQHKK